MNPSHARIYLDNAATSWPKPTAVYDAVDRAMRELGAPAGRGGYREAVEVERGLAQTRRGIAELIGGSDPRRVVFTLNCTDSLNIALHGLLHAGDDVVTTVVEHNSVLRPLRVLAQRGVTATYVGCDATGLVDPDQIRRAITARTRLIVLSHASNVTGAIQPAEAVGRIAAEHGLPLLLDAAQSLGHLELDVRKLHATLLAAPGHKGLLGPLGTGILYVADGVDAHVAPLRQGGTGTQSESDSQPDELPEKYEAGNQNVPGIFGLGAGVAYLQQQGIAALRQHQRELVQRLLDGLLTQSGVTVYGPRAAEQRVGVVSIRIAGSDPQESASILDSAFSIQVRPGLHCAPRMHETLGTAKTGGTLRFSVGPFNTMAEMDATVEAVHSIAGG